MSIYIRSVNLQDYYMIPYHSSIKKQAESDLTANLVLCDISLYKIEQRVSPGRSRSDVTGIGDGGGRSGNRFRRIVLHECRCEAGGEGGSGEPFYGSDMVIRSPAGGQSRE